MSNAEIIRELTRAKAVFQLRAIETVLTDGHAPHCRWCGRASIRWTACSCERAQEEARRIRGDDR